MFPLCLSQNAVLPSSGRLSWALLGVSHSSPVPLVCLAARPLRKQPATRPIALALLPSLLLLAASWLFTTAINSSSSATCPACPQGHIPTVELGQYKCLDLRDTPPCHAALCYLGILGSTRSRCSPPVRTATYEVPTPLIPTHMSVASARHGPPDWLSPRRPSTLDHLSSFPNLCTAGGHSALNRSKTYVTPI